jgi:hypothetical protein
MLCVRFIILNNALNPENSNIESLSGWWKQEGGILKGEE